MAFYENRKKVKIKARRYSSDKLGRRQRTYMISDFSSRLISGADCLIRQPAQRRRTKDGRAGTTYHEGEGKGIQKHHLRLRLARGKYKAPPKVLGRKIFCERGRGGGLFGASAHHALLSARRVLDLVSASRAREIKVEVDVSG